MTWGKLFYWSGDAEMVSIDYDHLPRAEVKTEGYDRSLRIGSASIGLRFTEEEVKHAADRHEELAADHLAAAKHLREAYEPTPEPVYREVEKTVVHLTWLPSRTLSTAQFNGAYVSLAGKGMGWNVDAVYAGIVAQAGDRYLHQFYATWTEKELVA